MSFITELHTFGQWAEKELEGLVKAEPKIEQVADSILKYVGGAATIIAGLEGGPAASTIVSGAVSEIQTGVVALSGLITDFGATPTAASMAASLATNAQSLLAAAEVKNPNSVKAATGIVTNLTNLATALTAAVPAPVEPAA
jgi:hypothetical protein